MGRTPRRAGLRERKKERTREELAAAALCLAEERGFDAVTVDEIAAAAEVSRSTFFRYFSSKEAVLFTWRDELFTRFEQELGRSERRETALGAVRRACLAIGEHYQRDRAAIIRHQTIVNASPALIAHELEVDRRWEDAIARALLSRSRGGVPGRRRALLLAGATMGLLRATLREWIARGGRPSLMRLGNEALDLLERESGLRVGERGPARRRSALR